MTNSRTSLTRTAFSWAAGGFALACVIGGVASAGAQAIASHDTSAPVSFDAGSFVIDDRANRVVLSGGVEVNQGGLKVRSNRMLAQYSDQGSLDISRITANGGVVVTRGNDRASGDSAVYDFSQRIITMAGNVRLSRGGDMLSGGRLVIDLDSGLSTIDGRGTGRPSPEGETRSSDGRVSGTFTVSQN